MDEDAQAFIAELETRRQAKITWKTYATWYGNNHAISREFGVFLYRCEDTFFFEDFERNPSMFGISLKSKKKKEAFSKYEGFFALGDVVSTRQVVKTQAQKVANSVLKTDDLSVVNLFDRVFRQLVEMVTLKDGSVHFFELIDRKAFAVALQA
ncbi:MAG: hypothetical protein EOM68_07470 [Spirochaetia bacterium]|jgi:hypothetical protein|nr:hypothetical protein [Spirochaetia bacterium]